MTIRSGPLPVGTWVVNSVSMSASDFCTTLTFTPVLVVKSSARCSTWEKRVSSAQIVRVATASVFALSEEVEEEVVPLLQAARAVAAARTPSAAMPRRIITPVLIRRVASISDLLHGHCNTSDFVSATIFAIVCKLLHL